MVVSSLRSKKGYFKMSVFSPHVKSEYGFAPSDISPGATVQEIAPTESLRNEWKTPGLHEAREGHRSSSPMEVILAEFDVGRVGTCALDAVHINYPNV